MQLLILSRMIDIGLNVELSKFVMGGVLRVSIVYVVVTNQPYPLLSVLFVDILFVFMGLNIQILAHQNDRITIQYNKQ